MTAKLLQCRPCVIDCEQTCSSKRLDMPQVNAIGIAALLFEPWRSLRSDVPLGLSLESLLG